VIRYAEVDDTTWPVDYSDDNEDSAQWTLRYGGAEQREKHRMAVASVLAAYAYLLDPGVTMKDATAALRRARRAQLSVIDAVREADKR
jgi:hypothetical protein